MLTDRSLWFKLINQRKKGIKLKTNSNIRLSPQLNSTKISLSKDFFFYSKKYARKYEWKKKNDLTRIEF